MSKSHFAQYMKSEYGKETIENEYGFCCYKLNEKEMFMSDLFIDEQYRSTIEAKKFFTSVIEIAKQKGCEFITGLVYIGGDEEKNKEKARVLRCYLAVGYYPVMCFQNPDQISLRYDL